MITAELFRPVLNDRPRSVNFFNGRLLSGEDLTAEQQAERLRRDLLGRAIGEGVVSGLEVEVDFASPPQSPTVVVRSGMGINANGHALVVREDVRLTLAAPSEALPAETTKLFGDCMPPQSGAYLSGEAVYLLTVCPASAAQGKAKVSGLGNQTAACQSDHLAEGVRFRLLEIPVTAPELAARDLLRNRIASLFLGLRDAATRVRDALRPELPGLIDIMRGDGRLTGCELPIAALHWVSGSGVLFADMYSVRRRPHRREPTYLRIVDDRQAAAAEAFALQFHDHIEFLRARGRLRTARARDHFELLPPAGLIPLATSAWPDGAELTTFFHDIVYKPLTFIEGARIGTILRYVRDMLPFVPASRELIRLHRVRENQQSLDTGGPTASRPYLLFVTGHAPDFSDPHYNVSRFDYSNYW